MRYGWGLAMVGGLLATAPAGAQPKPPPAGAQVAPAPGKFADAPPGAVPAPGAGPAPGSKFGPATPPPAAAPAPRPGPSAGGKFAPPASPPPASSPVAPPAALPPAVAIPADEPATVGRLRALLGPDVALRYGRAEPLPPDGGPESAGARLTDAVLERPDQRLDIAQLTLRGLRDDGVADAEARGVTLRRPGDEPTTVARVALTNLTVRRPAPGTPIAPDMLAADRLRIEGLATAGGNAVLIDQLELDDYGGGRQAGFRLTGLDVRTDGAGPVSRVRLARAAVRGLDLAGGLAALIAGARPVQPGGSYSIEAEGLALAGPDRALGSLAGLMLANEAPADPATPNAPELGRIALRGLRIEPFPGIEDWLARFRYPALTGELVGETRLERAGGRLDLTSLALTVPDAGVVRMAFSLAGVNVDATGPERFLAARFLGFTLGWRDDGLYPRFVRDQAARLGVSEPVARQQFAQQATAATAAAGRDAVGLTAIGEALRRFALGEAREVEIVARPPQPVPVAELAGLGAAGPVEAARRLGLSGVAR